jgi:hypothetical protein
MYLSTPESGRTRRFSHPILPRSGGGLGGGLLLTVAMLGLCMAVAGGFDLRAEHPSHKFNNTSVEAPKLPAPPQNTDEQRPQPPPPLALSGLSAIELLPPLVEAQEEPVPVAVPVTLLPVVFCDPGSLDCSCFRDLHQGDTPMLRTWNTLKLSSLMAATLVMTPLPALAQAEIPQNDLKTLQESVDALSKKLDAMNADINKALAGTYADMKALKDAHMETKLKVAALEGAVKALTDVGILKAEMDKLQGRGTVMYPPEKNVANASPVSTGRIQMANMYPEDMLFVVNGKTYKVAPFAIANLDNQPAGIFTYEVISGTYGRRGGNSPLLEPGKTYTITVR